LRDGDAIRRGVAQIEEDLGPLDILINNAGGSFVKDATDISEKGWAAVLDVNLTGTFRITQEVGKRMLARGAGAPEGADPLGRRPTASIVNVVIDTAQGVPGAVHAGAARSAVENLTKGLATEWASRGVRVNAIAPGTIDTKALEMYPAAIVESLKRVVPLGRLGRPEEVAWMVAYLASDAAAWVTGALFTIDGGARNYGAHWNVFQSAQALAKETTR